MKYALAISALVTLSACSTLQDPPYWGDVLVAGTAINLVLGR